VVLESQKSEYKNESGLNGSLNFKKLNPGLAGTPTDDTLDSRVGYTIYVSTSFLGT
jgi:hypothetical protein